MVSSVNTNSDSIRDIVDRLKDDVFEYLNEIENEFIKSEPISDNYSQENKNPIPLSKKVEQNQSKSHSDDVLF